MKYVLFPFILSSVSFPFFLEQGEFKDDKFNGHGKYYHSSGDSYEGEFVDGKFHGQGKYVCTNGAVMQGQFQNGTYVN